MTSREPTCGFGKFAFDLSIKLSRNTIKELTLFFHFTRAESEKAQESGVDFVNILKDKGLISREKIDDLTNALKYMKKYGLAQEVQESFQEANKTTEETRSTLERFECMVTFKFQCKDIKEYTIGEQQLNILLVGKTGNGKSATANLLLGKQGHFEVVHGTSSGTKLIQVESVKLFDQFEVKIVDTPGLFDTSGTLSNEDTILEIMKTAQELSKGVHVILFVCRANVRFTQEEMEAFNEIEKYFGNELLKHCMLVITHADSIVGTMTLEDSLKQNSQLWKIFEKTSKRAIAVENTHGGNSVINMNMKQKQLLHAIVDFVKVNDGKVYSNKLFEDAETNLQNERTMLKLQKQLYVEIFDFLFFKVSVQNGPKCVGWLGPTQYAVDCIYKHLSDDMVNCLPDKMGIKVLIKICFEEYNVFAKSLAKKNKEFKTDSSRYDSIISEIVTCINGLPAEALGNCEIIQVSKNKIYETIIDPLQPSEQTHPSYVVKQYIDLMLDEFTKQRQRLELMDFILDEGSSKIQQYFRSKNFSERKNVIANYIYKGSIPPDLHCECLKAIPDKFKSGNWDDIINKALFQMLVNRLQTEDAIAKPLTERLFSLLTDGLMIYSMLPVLMAFNPILGISFSVGMLAFPVALKVGRYVYNKRRYRLHDCKQCKSRHLEMV